MAFGDAGLEALAKDARPPLRMDALPFPDRHHVVAADGWLDLGLPSEALRELDQCSPETRRTSIASQVAWRAHAERRDWAAALAVAEHWVAEDPKKVGGWLNRSYALHELRRTGEASEALLPAAAMFPKDPIIRYNLACYACRMGDLDAARRWLREVVRIQDLAFLKALAMDDPDLETLRHEIAGWGADRQK